MINHFELTGLQQSYNNWKDKEAADSNFQINYLTPFMTFGHLLFTGIMTLYIFIAVKYLEEKDLRKAIGKEYEAYQQKVPMIVPFTKWKK